jgi:HEPN domain-containing protein
MAMAREYMRQASGRLRHAREALEERNHPYVVRRCQEAVELLLKAVLRLVGIEPPKWHDVGPTLRKEANRFPQWFRNLVSRLARISRKLRRERERSMYGDKESGVPPDELYDEEDAREALSYATEVFQTVSKLFSELTESES